ncbi:MAG TPA: glycosyltransferase, partial [Bacteroidetes bacterium]|nr:glycosyltransferase [Bacteroidota bacterium]
MNPIKLSVVVITLNEAENIGRCLDSVKSIADEMLIVDSFSTDATLEIAKN